MNDLFTPTGEWQRLDIPDGDVALLPGVMLPLRADTLLTLLIEATPWRQDDIKLYGRAMRQPRLHAWYGDADAVYTYSGLRNRPLPWTPALADLRTCVEQLTGATFNSVLLNLYRDGRDSMGMHADNEPELGPQPVIASLSLGATRTFILKHRHHKAMTLRIGLNHADLLVMRGETQSHWLHGVNKATRPCGKRLNLTFRLIKHQTTPLRR